MAEIIIVSSTTYPENPNITYIAAQIDGVTFNEITPKVILNKGIVSPSLYPGKTDIKYKGSSYITSGINIVDIDFNKVKVDDKIIGNASDFFKLMEQVYKTSEQIDGWEYVGDPTATPTVTPTVTPTK